jgi:sugar/nucleoside kinase (ribokinase family)
MKKEFDVLSVGLIVQDILVKPVPKQLPEADSVAVEQCTYMPGGDAMNQSIILSRLGAKVCLVGKVGNDSSGRILLEHAREFGVDTSNVKIDSN